MNYFELINKCLVELNYKTCANFSDLVKNDHKKIKNILNIINSEICSFDNWNFLLRKQTLTVPENTREIENSIQGRLNTLVIDNRKYKYCNDFEIFLLNKAQSGTYTVFNDKILLPKFDTEKSLDVIYYTTNFAKSDSDEDKNKMELESDKSVIPDPFVEPILIYGTCMRLKGNMQNPKFSYWYTMYKEALSNMRAKIGTIAFETPTISVKRS